MTDMTDVKYMKNFLDIKDIIDMKDAIPFDSIAWEDVVRLEIDINWDYWSEIQVEIELDDSIFEILGINYIINFFCNTYFISNFDDVFGFFVTFLIFTSIVFGVITEILWYTHFFNKRQTINYSKSLKKSFLGFFIPNLVFRGYYLSVYLEFFE